MKTIKDLKDINVEQFYGLLFDARNKIHSFHLKTKSYSEHKALNEFYDEILDLTDEFLECYQGQFGLITFEDYQLTDNDSVAYLSKFVEKVKKFQDLTKESHLKNIIDEMIALTYRTLYKLKFLK